MQTQGWGYLVWSFGEGLELVVDYLACSHVGPGLSLHGTGLTLSRAIQSRNISKEVDPLTVSSAFIYENFLTHAH